MRPLPELEGVSFTISHPLYRREYAEPIKYFEMNDEKCLEDHVFAVVIAFVIVRKAGNAFIFILTYIANCSNMEQALNVYL